MFVRTYVEAECCDFKTMLYNQQLPICVGDGRGIYNLQLYTEYTEAFMPSLVSLVKIIIAEITRNR